ncbi:unnamed protein product [Caenorhabditis sp. 36 PRJEB53466]|nr:unnamed protein product [Caenorhabditis sp. 36 PRJEB53466]
MADAEKIVLDSIKLTKDCLDIGKFASEELAKTLPVFGAFGVLVIDLIGASQHKKDSVKPMLQKLENNIRKLSQQTAKGFDDMKAFVTEQSFSRDILMPVSTLIKFMLPTVEDPNTHNVEHFRKECAATSALRIANDMLSCLERSATNPLKMAMAAETEKSTATFNKWKNLLMTVMGELLMLETYINAMFWQRNMWGPNEMMKKAKVLEEHIDQWETELRTTTGRVLFRN